MPRSRRPQKYPTICARLSGLLETHTSDFYLDFPQQRQAIDLRQMLYSYGKACEHEADRERKLKNFPVAERYATIFAVLGRWIVSIDPPYEAGVPQLLDAPARLHFRLRDLLPVNLLINEQLDAIESQVPVPEPSPEDILSLFSPTLDDKEQT